MADARNHELGQTRMPLSIEMVCVCGGGGVTAVQNNKQLSMKPFLFLWNVKWLHDSRAKTFFSSRFDGIKLWNFGRCHGPPATERDKKTCLNNTHGMV
jgi:hypothetical protein